MIRFRHFAAAVERIDRYSRVLLDRLKSVGDGRFLAPVTRSAVELAAQELEELISKESPFPQPVDMLDDEWGEAEIVLLRGAIDTLGAVASQRPKDFMDWVRDARLAVVEFHQARARFYEKVEF